MFGWQKHGGCVRCCGVIVRRPWDWGRDNYHRTRSAAPATDILRVFADALWNALRLSY